MRSGYRRASPCAGLAAAPALLTTWRARARRRPNCRSSTRTSTTARPTGASTRGPHPGILEKAAFGRALVSSTPDDGTITLDGRTPAHRADPAAGPHPRGHGPLVAGPLGAPYVQERLRRRCTRASASSISRGADRTSVIKRITEIALRESIYLHAHSRRARDRRAVHAGAAAAHHLGPAGMCSARRRWAPCSTATRTSGWTWRSGTATWPRAACSIRAGARCSCATGPLPRRHRQLDDFALGGAAGLGDGSAGAT